MESIGDRLLIAGLVLLAVFLIGAGYVHSKAASWERIEPTRKLEYLNQTMERELGRPVTPDRGLLESTEEKFGVYRWVCWGGAGLGGLLLIIGWAVAPRSAQTKTADHSDA